MYKVADLVVYAPPGSKFFPTLMHKSFVLHLIFPLFLTGPDALGVHPRFWNWEGWCLT